jgi:hypothetical protein
MIFAGSEYVPAFTETNRISSSERKFKNNHIRFVGLRAAVVTTTTSPYYANKNRKENCMAKPKEQENGKSKNPENVYQRGDSWVVDFYHRGRRCTKNLGESSRSIASERATKWKGRVLDGKEIVAGSRWDGCQWVSAVENIIEDLLFEDAMTKHLEWYESNRGADTYEKYATPASKALAGSSTRTTSTSTLPVIWRYIQPTNGCFRDHARLIDPWPGPLVAAPSSLAPRAPTTWRSRSRCWR